VDKPAWLTLMPIEVRGARIFVCDRVVGDPSVAASFRFCSASNEKGRR
jgi:hypothetical protein